MAKFLERFHFCIHCAPGIITFQIVTKSFIFQGKGLMDTYWLTCKEGGINRTIEMETQSYFMVSLLLIKINV